MRFPKLPGTHFKTHRSNFLRSPRRPQAPLSVLAFSLSRRPGEIRKAQKRVRGLLRPAKQGYEAREAGSGGRIAGSSPREFPPGVLKYASRHWRGQGVRGRAGNHPTSQCLTIPVHLHSRQWPGQAIGVSRKSQGCAIKCLPHRLQMIRRCSPAQTRGPRQPSRPHNGAAIFPQRGQRQP